MERKKARSSQDVRDLKLKVRRKGMQFALSSYHYLLPFYKFAAFDVVSRYQSLQGIFLQGPDAPETRSSAGDLSLLGRWEEPLSSWHEHDWFFTFKEEICASFFTDFNLTANGC